MVFISMTELIAPANSSMHALQVPLTLPGGLTLPNRVVQAPCTRNRATADLSPSAGASDYYAARAEAGLLITEATLITPDAQGYLDTPGLFLDSHVAAWSVVTHAVHDRGGRIFAQLWHTGRISHSHWSGCQPVSASAVLDPILRRQAGANTLYNEMPRALSSDEVRGVVGLFRRAAQRALDAGFDGVEIHGANGYLIEQFLRQHTNRRDDDWGGSTAGRSRFALEVVRACLAVWGPGRVGLRLSPAAYFGEMRWREGDNETYIHLLQNLAREAIAYVHTGVVEDKFYPELGATSSEFLRQHWPGVLIGNGGYSPESAAQKVAKKSFDLIAFGKLFLANPDLVPRIFSKVPLLPYTAETMQSLR